MLAKSESVLQGMPLDGGDSSLIMNCACYRFRCSSAGRDDGCSKEENEAGAWRWNYIPVDKASSEQLLQLGGGGSGIYKDVMVCADDNCNNEGNCERKKEAHGSVCCWSLKRRLETRLSLCIIPYTRTAAVE